MPCNLSSRLGELHVGSCEGGALPVINGGGWSGPVVVRTSVGVSAGKPYTLMPWGESHSRSCSNITPPPFPTTALLGPARQQIVTRLLFLYSWIHVDRCAAALSTVPTMADQGGADLSAIGYPRADRNLAPTPFAGLGRCR